MCLHIVFSLLAFSSIFSKWIFALSSQDSWAALISCSSDVSLTFLLLAACQLSRMFCSSIMVYWSSSCLFLCSRYLFIHLPLSRLRDKCWMSYCCSWMISLSFELCEPKSVSSFWIRMKSISYPPEGPSSCNGRLPLSCTYSANGGNESPSTSGRDNTHFSTANNLLVPFW